MHKLWKTIVAAALAALGFTGAVGVASRGSTASACPAPQQASAP